MQADTWLRVSRANPCPVCKKPDWCGVSADGVWAVCMRTEGGKASRNGGWLHRLKESPPPPMRRPPTNRPRQLVDCAAYHAALRKRWDWRLLDGLALSLGVGMEALDALEPALDELHAAFAFPMRDGSGAVVGVRLRNHEGRKWAVTGSREGLFFDPAIAECRDLVVCEGPTDCAAARTLGLQAVGRPSCAGAVAELAALARRLRVRSVTIVADHDAPKRRPDGSVWNPGIDGAFAMGRALKRMWRVVVPPAKDVRAWVCGGATREQFDALAASATWRLA